MRIRLSAFTTIIFLLAAFQSIAASYHYEVLASDIHNGYIQKKIWLNNSTLPEIKIITTAFKDCDKLPLKITPSSPYQFSIALGKERKKPFVLIDIPAYSTDPDTKKSVVLTDITITVNEQEQSKTSLAKISKTSAANSVLSTGTWYKIAVPSTGLYKIDFAFLQKAGINVNNINSANIRLFGNGGNMLSENNAVQRPTDLVENAILMNDGGTGIFGTNAYFIFYAVGTTAWYKDSINKRFNHQNNLYADSAYYFLTLDQGQGLRISSQQGTLIPTTTVTDFNDYAVHDLDLVNPAQQGKEWYGEQFEQNAVPGTSQNFSFTFGTSVSTIHSAIKVSSISSTDNNVFNISLNNQHINDTSLDHVYSNLEEFDPIIDSIAMHWDGVLNNQTATFNITYLPTSSSAIGFLNFIEINVRRPLAITGPQLGFRDWKSVGAGNIANYQLQNANSQTQVWDISNPQVPVIMNGTLSGNTYSFSQNAQTLHEFVAMNSTNFNNPVFKETVVNQNLHGSGQMDMIIVSYSGFLDAANKTADFHRGNDNMRVIVASTEQVYNEFSSGSQDISAIRDFARMFYVRAGNDSTEMPKYLLLIGGASYDYKNRVSNNSNYLPTFETACSHDNIDSYCTDDFFGFLDDNENIEDLTIPNTLDIGVGRIPARNLTDALGVYNKISTYKSASSLGPWRLSTTFCGDKSDGAGKHMQDAENMSECVQYTSNNLYNETKVFVDDNTLTITPGGNRCPNCNATINDQIFKGTFLVNYNGHGNTELWSYERILTPDDYNTWTNINKLPFAVTATCDFGQFDQPSNVSAGEKLLLKSDGGVIAALITTQAVFEGSNNEIDQQYLSAQFSPVSSKWNCFGDAVRAGKNITYHFISGDITNFRKFSLLGDPALVPDFPKYSIRTDSIKDGITLQNTDSVKALGLYTIYGSVRDNNNNILNSFNGNLSVTMFDKPITRTVASDRGPVTFKVQDNIVYKAKATFQNGQFSYTFIAPKDINYNYGRGKISSYAENGMTDAAQVDTSAVIGGFSDHPTISTQGPVVKPYINDSFFINGGITGPNSTLFVALYDQTGINIAGNSVGHDLTAVLDNNVTQPYILNDYYETLPNTYKQGYIYFPLSNLTNGKHSITVKAWDVNDNFGEGRVDFVVVNGSVMQIKGLMNYPNPFRDNTHIVFEHNHPNEHLDVKIAIYNTSGSLVRMLDESFIASDSRTNEVTWDGTDNSNIKLPSGLYIYRAMVKTDSGISATGYQKLVLIR